MDENVPIAVAEQLVQHGLDAVSARSLDQLSDSDSNHLQRATEMERIFCTSDEDFLKMAAECTHHTGIAFGHQYQATIGGWVIALRALHARMSAEEVVDQVIYLAVK
jgi:hypothetical protein